MSHFFTKDKQTQLEQLSEHIDLEALSTAAEGQVLKANSDGLFTVGSDLSGIPVGATEGQVLSWDEAEGAPAWIDPPAGGDSLPPTGASEVGHFLTVVESEGEWVWAASEVNIPTSIGDLIGGDPDDAERMLQFNGTDWVTQPFPTASADNLGSVLKCGVLTGDGDPVYYWYGSAAEEMPEGSADGEILVWEASGDRTQDFSDADPVEFVDGDGEKLAVAWVSEERWADIKHPLTLRLLQDSAEPDGFVAADLLEGFVLVLKADWTTIPPEDLDNDILSAINESPVGGDDIEATVTGDVSLSAAILGFNADPDDGSITNGEAHDYILKGAAHWVAGPPPEVSTDLPDAASAGEVLVWTLNPAGDGSIPDSWQPSNAYGVNDFLYLGGSDNVMLEAPEQLARYGEGDLNINAVTQILATNSEGDEDMNTMVVVLDDWTTAQGTATLELKNGSFGQVVYIKNLSAEEDPAERSIEVQCGNGDPATGSVDGESGVGVELPPMSAVKLLCISATGDGEWIIL